MELQPLERGRSSLGKVLRGVGGLVSGYHGRQLGGLKRQDVFAPCARLSQKPAVCEAADRSGQMLAVPLPQKQREFPRAIGVDEVKVGASVQTANLCAFQVIARSQFQGHATRNPLLYCERRYRCRIDDPWTSLP